MIKELKRDNEMKSQMKEKVSPKMYLQIVWWGQKDQKEN